MGFNHPYWRNRNRGPWVPRKHWKRRPWWQRSSFYWQMRNLILAVVVGALVTQYAIKHNASSLLGFDPPTAVSLSSPVTSISEGFDLCDGPVRVSCIVDGDTIWYRGVKIRLLDIDAPEIRDYKCASELALGQRAKLRLLELMNAGPFEVVADGDRDKDVYGRKLRHINRNGQSLGDILIAEGLASRWEGQHQAWC